MARRILPTWLVAGLATFVLVVVPTRATADVVLSATDSGWYLNDGYHGASNDNYIVGSYNDGGYRNFIVFDLTGVTDTILGAQVRLANPSGGFTGEPRIYSFFDVFTEIPLLTSSSSTGPSGLAIYNDLGTGTLYGSRSVSSADNESVVLIDLNAAAVAALNGGRGGLFALGGDLVGASGENYSFGYTGGPFTRELVLTTTAIRTPEPSALALAGLAAFGLLLRRRGHEQPA